MKENARLIVLGIIIALLAGFFAATYFFASGRIPDNLLFKRRIGGDAKNTYSGEAYDYMFITGETGNSLTVNIYTYNNQVCLYVQGTAGGNTYSRSEVLKGTDLYELSELILSAESDPDSSTGKDTAWLMRKDGRFVRVEPVPLEKYGITAELIYKGPFPDKAKLESDKKIFEGVGIEDPLGGQYYGVSGTEDTACKLPDSDYTMVADQIRKAVGSDSFTIVSMESEGYRKGMHLTVRSSGGADYVLSFTGHGLLTEVSRPAGPQEVLH